jgi:histidine kinase-like protein
MLSPCAPSHCTDADGNPASPDDCHRAHLSVTEEVVPLIEALAAAMQSHDYPEHDTFGMRLALEEALVNAIKHGHRYDPSKQVAVRYQINPSHTLVEVPDRTGELGTTVGAGAALDAPVHVLAAPQRAGQRRLVRQVFVGASAPRVRGRRRRKGGGYAHNTRIA